VIGDSQRRPTVCVTGAGAGVDSVREQEKLEARKILENAAESPASSAPRKSGGSFFTPETVQQRRKVYSQATDRQAVQSSGGMPQRHPRGAPWLPVSLIYTLVARGGKDPDEEANPHKRPGSVDFQQGVEHEEERQTDEGDGGSATL
jgi:hypothetical protein